jgi:hypothetical protein
MFSGADGRWSPRADEYLRRIQDWLPTDLVAPPAFAGLVGVAAHLARPAQLMIECSLTAPTPPADLSAGYYGPDASIAPPLDQLLAAAVVDRFREAAAWRGLERLLALLATPTSPLHDSIWYFWLEFDVASPPPAVPLPNVFCNLRPGAPDLTVMAAAAEAVWGEPPPAATVRCLARCVELLPSGSWLFNIGVMVARRSASLRLVLRRLGMAQIVSFLRAIGWPGQPEALVALVSPAAEHADHLWLHVDVASGVQPRLGVEYHLAGPLRETRSGWSRLLDRLVESGLCLPAKRDALLQWPGYSSETLDEPCLLERRINHVKVAYEPEGPREAKVYLSLTQRPLPAPGWLGSVDALIGPPPSS